MGTTLTGTKIKDTYKSLIKVTNNTEAGSTGKQLSDGDGNDLGIFVDTDGVVGVGAAANCAIDASSKNDAIQVPNGTTAQRPDPAGSGMIRYNTTLAKMEYYDTAWKEIYEIDVDDSTIEDDATNGLQIKDNGVSHDKLENRYTVKTETSHATGAYSLDWSAGTTWEFTATLTGNIELDFTNFKQGQVIDIYGLTGSFTITLDSDAATSETFNKVGGVDYDGASTNHLQIVCLDDSDDAVFNYTIATYESDSTPS